MEEFKKEIELLDEDYQIKLDEFIDSFDEEYNCSLMRLEQNKYQFRFFCKFSDRDQDYIIEINECVRF